MRTLWHLAVLLFRDLFSGPPPAPDPRRAPVEYEVVRAMGGLSVGCPCGERALVLHGNPLSRARLESFRVHPCKWGPS